MKKKIGITCDDYKADFFRKGLLREGYEIVYDGGDRGIHLFKIEVDEKDFESMKVKVGKTAQRLNLKFKHSTN